MGNPVPQLRTHNIVWVPIGSPQQNWHYDDRSTKELKRHRYFTILVSCFPVKFNFKLSWKYFHFKLCSCID